MHFNDKGLLLLSIFVLSSCAQEKADLNELLNSSLYDCNAHRAALRLSPEESRTALVEIESRLNHAVESFDSRLEVAFQQKQNDWDLRQVEEYSKIQTLRDFQLRLQVLASSSRDEIALSKANPCSSPHSNAQALAQGPDPKSSLQIYPSTSSEGNITGRRFPRGTWVMTFDDGPHVTRTLEIAEELKKRNVSATFFMLSQNAWNRPKVLSTLKKDGFEIASHSKTHPQFPRLGDAALEEELVNATKDIEALADQEIRFFRLPYGEGVNNPRVRTKIAEAGLIHVFWNIDTLDWKNDAPSVIVRRTLQQMALQKNGGGVILFHDIHARSVTASALVMDAILEDPENRLCNLGSVVDELNGLPSTCQPPVLP